MERDARKLEHGMDQSAWKPESALRSSSAEEALFSGVFLAGFECSCQKLEDGRRVDMTESTRHDVFASADYERLAAMGMTAARDGANWVRAEQTRGQYDFSLAHVILRAADRARVQVIWDLMHFGWPDDVDVFSPQFVLRFGCYAHAFAAWLREHSDANPFISPINEISFLAWAGGDVRCMNPFEAARGVELKAQLVLATIEAIEAIRRVFPRARFLQPEPIINIVARPEHPSTWRRIESDNLLQYQTWDMLTGRVWPSLGGRADYLDIVGVNVYPNNQFTLDGETIELGDRRFRPVSEMMMEVWTRYRRPMIVSETGSEDHERAGWFRYVACECRKALGRGCELHGITLYPIVNHPGWLDGRHCHNGLWDYADERGHRPLYDPLAQELRRQAGPLSKARAERLRCRAETAAWDPDHEDPKTW